MTEHNSDITKFLILQNKMNPTDMKEYLCFYAESQHQLSALFNIMFMQIRGVFNEVLMIIHGTTKLEKPVTACSRVPILCESSTLITYY